jgi:RNA polymerase sigma-70 factor (ECF subfamily)
MPDRKKPAPPSSSVDSEEEAKSEDEDEEEDEEKSSEDEAEVPPDPLEQKEGRGATAAPPTVELAIRDALKKGDVKFALTLAASHYRAPLIRFCMAFVHDETTAEDVAQTAMTVAAERATEFSGQSTFRTWIFGIARHKALDAAAARQGMPLSAVTDSKWIADAIGPITGLQKADDLTALEAVLQGLGDETRGLLTLRFREELSYKEIADAFEITEQAARKRMFDALEKIRKLLVNKRSDFFDSR